MFVEVEAVEVEADEATLVEEDAKIENTAQLLEDAAQFEDAEQEQVEEEPLTQIANGLRRSEADGS